MEGTYTKNGWQQTTQKNFNRKTTNEMGRWFFSGGKNRPRGLSLIVDDDDDDDEHFFFSGQEFSVLGHGLTNPVVFYEGEYDIGLILGSFESYISQEWYEDWPEVEWMCKTL